MNDSISEILDNLMKHEDVLACKFCRENAGEIVPKNERFKQGIDEIWTTVDRSMDSVFKLAHGISQMDDSEIKIKNDDYFVLYYLLPSKMSVLTAVIPRETNNLGLIETEMEKTRREIVNLIQD